MRATFDEFKKKALADPEVKEEYRTLSPAYALRKQLIKIRKDAVKNYRLTSPTAGQ